MLSDSSFSIGIDVGGTFTDAVAIDHRTGEQRWSKVPTTPPGFIDGVLDAVESLSLDPTKISKLAIHATTIGINAVVERKLPQGALICTEGFRDFLEVRHSRRPDLYNPWWNKPPSLIERKYRIGVPERIDAKGKVVRGLDKEKVRKVVSWARKQGVVTYAVCTLFSFLNPQHERKIRDLIAEGHPDAYVSLSSDVAPIIREYERTSTTVINSLLMPVMSTYVTTLELRLKEKGVVAPLMLMRSNGGNVPVETAKWKPVELLEGGHAAGSNLACRITQPMNSPNVITYDGGGTTATLSLVENSEPVYGPWLEFGFEIVANTPSISVKSIGQGGGAIAWIDKGDALRVGPASAAAFPGPACYGLGGTAPTLTDALVLLGILDPEFDWIRGEAWDHEAAETAIGKIASNFGWGLTEAAHAIYRVGVSNVSFLLREEIVAKGRDPRDFALVAIGGSGPMLASQLALEQDISKVIVPAALGTASALGCLLSDPKYEYLQSYLALVEQIERETLEGIGKSLKARALSDLKRDGITQDPRFEFFGDFRYSGEHWEVTVPLSLEGRLDPKIVNEGVSKFHSEHQRLYGFSRLDEPVEIVTIMMRMLLAGFQPPIRKIAEKKDVAAAVKGTRSVYFKPDEASEATIYVYDELGAGSLIQGPAVIQRRDGTVPVFPRCTCEIDDHGNSIITLKE